ncbi:MAG: DUF4190 domain-containing protein [Verrucomicrobia bacterium]|nr:DUF4190 domain-containing protein [Verrucomicrobiota bacterium]
MYKIRGSDGKEYGPVGADLLRQWLAEGRINNQTSAQADGTSEWKALGSFPEFVQPIAGSGFAAPAQPAKTSGLAITSLVMGVLGCLGITALAGLVLGIVALVKIKKSEGRLGGQGLAIAGICVSGLMLLVIPLWLALMLPALAKAKSRAQTIACVNNMKQVALGVRIYANDHNDSFPPAATWCDAVLPSVGTKNVLKCPAERAFGTSTYGYNAKLDGKKASEIDPQTVMIFECKPGWNTSGGAKDMVSHHFGTYVVALADGSVQQVSGKRMQTLRWDP